MRINILSGLNEASAISYPNPKQLRRLTSFLAGVCALSGALVSARAATGPGFALQFDGTNGAVQLQNPSAPFSNPNGTFTVEFWAYPTALRDGGAPESDSGTAGSSGQRYAIFPDQGENAYGAGHAAIGVSVGSNGIGVFARGTSYFPQLLAYNSVLNGWTHVAVVVETNRPRLYLNGTLVRTGVASSRILHPSINLGDPGLNYGMYQGQLDEVRVWKSLRSKSEIQSAMNTPLAGNESGLSLYYRLDEGAGDLIDDSAVDQRDGQRFASVAGFPNWVSSTAPVGVPIVTTGAISDLQPTSAGINGSIQPHGITASAWFEWGTTTNYGNVTAATAVPIGFSPIAIFKTISSLIPGTTYHYRLTATNSVGSAHGDDASFVAPFFGELNTGLPEFGFGFAVGGDLNNDGWLDVVLDGAGSAGNYGDAWRNNGDGTFTRLFYSVPYVQNDCFGSLADFDNDGDLDLAFIGSPISGQMTQIRVNTGTGLNDIGAGITPVENGGIVWGDYDNDGRPDILVAGYAGGSSYASEIWRNTGSGFVNIHAGLPGVTGGAVAWGDYDNDGRLDFLLVGATNPSYIAQVWRNTGNGFTNINAGISGSYLGSAAWGDYDNDGRLDLAITGYNGSQYFAAVWRNTGTGFTNVNAGLPSSGVGSVAWGDYDNDGRLDLLIAGQNRTEVWRNTVDGFVQAPVNLPAMVRASASWGDYDNDGRLDILLSEGTTGVGAVAGIWRNASPITNTVPTAPNPSSATPTVTGIELRWNRASDAQTPASGLSYNIRVGTTPGGSDIVSPEANVLTGLRRHAALGNAQMRTNALLNLPVGHYYWSVQAIDTAWAGGVWSAEQSFEVGGSRFTQISRQASDAIQLELLGYIGRTYRVEAATDLSAPADQWQTVTNVTIGASGVYSFIDAGAANSPTRFYRAIAQ